MAFVPAASSVDVNFYGSGSSVDIPLSQHMFGDVLGFFGGGQRTNYMQSVSAPIHQPPRTDTEVYEEEMSERDKVLDQHVVYYLKNHPEFYDKHNLVRVRESVYKIDGREISVDWHHPDNPAEQGYLLVVDGNMQQPFADYVQGTGLNIEYLDKRGRKVKQLAEAPAAARVQPAQAQTHGSPLYCKMHDTSEKRRKAQSRDLACSSCRDVINTNYVEFCICPGCSNSQHRCMCCGANANASTHTSSLQDTIRNLQGLSLNATTLNVNAGRSEVTSEDRAASKQGQPSYCTRHNQSDKRRKTKPRDLDCSNCGKSIQTNYVEFALCPSCSQEQQRCMCCGETASSSNLSGQRSPSQNIYAPAPRAANRLSTSKPPPSARPPPSSKPPGGGFLPSAWPSLPTGLFSSPQKPPNQDRYNAYASQKPLTAQNRGLSFVSVAPSCVPMQNPMATYNVVNPMASRRF